MGLMISVITTQICSCTTTATSYGQDVSHVLIKLCLQKPWMASLVQGLRFAESLRQGWRVGVFLQLIVELMFALKLSPQNSIPASSIYFHCTQGHDRIFFFVGVCMCVHA